ncbi:MAG: hypothetical protein WDO69_09860 [Pseudomonadota bacterium]
MKSIIKRSVVLAAGAGILLVAAVSSVSAHGISAAAGSPADGLAAACFTAYSGTVTANSNCNNSLVAKKWDVPLMVDSQGWKGATYGGSNVGCVLIGSDQVGNSVSTASSTPIGWAGGTSSTGQVWVPAAGRLVLECDLGTTGTLTNVNYTN